MELWVTHSQIVNGAFDHSLEPVFLKVSNMDEAVEYFDRTLGDQIAQIRRDELLTLAGTFSPVDDDFVSLKNFGVWHSCFFEHPNHEGDDICIGKLFNPWAAAIHPLLHNFDWERDLSQRDDGRFDDTITSVKSRNPSKYWMLFEHPNFTGRGLLGFGDRNLHDTPGNMDDQASSILASGHSAEAIHAGLKALLGA